MKFMQHGPLVRNGKQYGSGNQHHDLGAKAGAQKAKAAAPRDEHSNLSDRALAPEATR